MRFDFNTILADRRAQWLRRNAPLLLGVLLLIAVAWQSAALSWSLVTTFTSEPVLPPPASLEQDADASPGTESMTSVAEMHLFGTAERATDSLEAAAAAAPETRLNLKLRGILAADQSEMSRAIISSGNQDDVYSVGASLPGGATVEAVLADRVLLRRAGRLETLRLPREGADGGISYTEETSRDRADDDVRRDFGGIREELARDPKRLSELVRYSPVLQDGEIRGYRLYPGSDRSRFAQLGLQPGDIVTAINGTPLSDPGQAMEMLNSLTDQSNITLTVERGGTTQEINFSPSM